MELSNDQRSNVAYAILSVLLVSTDETQGADDLIHALHVGDEDNAKLKDGYSSIVEPADLVESLVNAIDHEFRYESGTPFDVVVTALKNLYDILVTTGWSDGSIAFAGELLKQYEADIIEENVDANN